MPAQPSVSCAVERRFRSMTTTNNSDLRHAAREVARNPDSAYRRVDLEKAQRNKEMVHEGLLRHLASCEACFESGATL